MMGHYWDDIRNSLRNLKVKFYLENVRDYDSIFICRESIIYEI